MIDDHAKAEKGKKNDLISVSESESLNVINEVKKTERNKYICPEKGCDLIPRIISVHSEIGKIVMQCPNNHFKEIDVETYFEIIDEKARRNIEPKENVKRGENYDSDSSDKGTLISNNGNNENKDEKIIEEKNKDISNIIRAYNRLLLTQENQPGNYLHNQNLINLGSFILSENSRYFEDNNNLKNSINESTSNNPNKIVNNYETTFDNVINKLKKEKKQEKTALDKLEIEFGIYLKDYYQDEKLILKLKGAKDESKHKKLGDKGFEYISQIRFKNLIEINLANNNIIDITNLNNMLLPHLESLNLSNNQIANIEPVANILSKNLNDIYLQHNQIENIKPLLNAKFSIESLEVLRIDNNKFSIDKNPDIQKLLQIYKEKIIYEIKDWSSFNKKYNSNIDKNDTKLDLGSRRDNNIIIDLFPLVVHPNDIKILILDNNKIQDASLLGKMPLYYLETLDLSLNLISSIIFLKKLSTKCPNLKILYLHENKINDISPLYTYKYNEKEGKEGKNDNEEKKNKKENGQSCLAFEKLETLTLKNNSLDLEDKETKDIFKTFLKNNNLTIDYKEDEIPPDKKSESDQDEKSKKHTGEMGMLPAQLGND